MTTTSSRAGEPAHPLVGADRVSGTAVFDVDGEKLGKVEDIVIDKVSGRVAYAILSSGGVLGIGARFHPLPWRLLTYDPALAGYATPLQPGDLDKAPAIDETRLSGWTDTTDREAIHSFYAGWGIGPYWI